MTDPTCPPSPKIAKTCTLCEKVIPLEDFSPSARASDGRQSRCRACCAKVIFERRANNAERLARKAEAARRLAEGVKFCRGCEVEHPIDNFARCAEAPDGRDARCKECNNQYNRDLYNRDLERRRAVSREKSRKLRGTAKRLEYERRWRKANRERMRENHRARVEADSTKEREKAIRRRARMAGAAIGVVDQTLLWIRQCGLCGLCGTRIDSTLAFPDPMSKSIDHIIPLSKGGSHSQRNVQWAHLWCNQSKGAKLPTAAA